MKSELKEPGKKFVQVSLPADFAALVRSHADLADRSMADQLKHWGRIASAIESVVPSAALSELKGAGSPREVLPRLAAYLSNPTPSTLLARLEAAQAPRYGVDPADPKVAMRVDPDGTVTRGTFDSQGTFVPQSSSTERKEGNEPRKKSTVPAKRRSAGKLGAAQSSRRQPQTA